LDDVGNSSWIKDYAQILERFKTALTNLSNGLNAMREVGSEAIRSKFINYRRNYLKKS